MSKRLRPMLGALLCVSFAWGVSAAPGDWDRSFAQNGRLKLELPGVLFGVRAWELQPDGKVVIVGHTLSEPNPGSFFENSEFIVARFTTGGMPDTTFDGDGYLKFVFGSDVIGTVDLERQADGKLLIVGQAGVPSPLGNTTDRARLLRLNADGSRDLTYGTNGEIELAWGNSNFTNPGLKLTPNGSALVYGDFGVNNSSELGGVGLVRVTAAGQLDSNFGTNGLAVLRGPDHLSPYRLAFTADGSIVIGGTIGPYNNYMPAVGRVTSAGQADSTFGTGGLLVLPFLQGEGWVTAVAALPDGRVLVAGEREDGNGATLPFVARINHNGSMDTTFGSSGRIIPAAARINSLVVQPDGRIVAGGSAAGANGMAPALLARYNTDGSPDLNFGVRGIALTDFAIAGDDASSSVDHLLRNADGSHLGLVTINNATTWRGTWAIARFLPQGAAAGVLGIRAEYENSGFTGFSIGENAGQTRFFVTRTGGTEGQVTVQYRVLGETATAGLDFTPVTGTLTFNDGETTTHFDVPVIDDHIPESSIDERFYAEIFNPAGGAAISKPRATIQINRDNDSYTSISFLSDNIAVTESGTARVVLARERNLADPVTINYNVVPQTATPGSDYDAGASTGSVSWAAGEGGVRVIDIPIVDDGVQEPDEYASVRFSEATGLANVANEYRTITIVDDDDAAASSRLSFDSAITVANESQVNAAWTLRRSGDVSQALDLPWTVNASTPNPHGAVAGQDFLSVLGTLHWNAGESAPKVIEVPLFNDANLEFYEYFSVSLASPVNVLGGSFGTAILVDDDGAIADPVITLGTGSAVSEGAGTVSVTATLTGTPVGAVSASWAANFGTASANDFNSVSSSLYWAAGDTAPKTITIAITQDSRDELDETFTVNLTAPTGGAILANPVALFTILDDDATPPGQPGPVAPGVEAVASTVTVNESTQTATFQLRRVGEATDGINAYVYGQDGTATAPSDYVAPGVAVSWDPNETAVKTVEVQINGDTIAESTESATLRLASFTWFGGNQPPTNLTLSITDDDDGSTPPPPPARVAFVNATETVAESATTLTLQVSRTGNTSVASSVDYTTTAGTASAADFTATSGTLTWAAGDTASKSLTITLLPDTADEPDENFTVTLSAPSTGTEVDVATATVTITDDDATPPTSGGGGGGSSSGGGSSGGGKRGGGGAESALSLLALAAILGARRQRRRPSLTSAGTNADSCG